LVRGLGEENSTKKVGGTLLSQGTRIAAARQKGVRSSGAEKEGYETIETKRDGPQGGGRLKSYPDWFGISSIRGKGFCRGVRVEIRLIFVDPFQLR